VDPGFDALRELILVEERRRLEALEHRLNDPATRAEDIGSVLAEAMAIRVKRDKQLGRVLSPLVEEGLMRSVRENPKVLAEALFPVIGPAIRRAVSNLLEQMLQGVNRTLEYSVSPRGLSWRLEAIRTGRPFAEIVLLRTLAYRVEEALLIHRETGLPLVQVSRDPGRADDAPLVSGMLTALEDFARDSFRTAEGELHTFEVGDLTVVVEQGPYALLACAVRGQPPKDLSNLFQDALEAIHLRFSEPLEAFQGDAAPFEEARPILEMCLETRFRDDDRKEAAKVEAQKQAGPGFPRWLAWLAGLAVVAGLVVWIVLGRLETNRWSAYLERLRAQPGLVVVGEGWHNGKRFVSGLRDPLAADPNSLIGPSGLRANQIAASWTPYQALEPRFVLERARRALEAPSGVSLKLQDGVLIASGMATQAWVARARNLSKAIAGVQQLDDRGIVIGP
jgi:OOP family OmpA-OmpF porin